MANEKDMRDTDSEWPDLGWDEIVDRASKSVFRMYAGSSAGTAFLVALGYDSRSGDCFATFATAWHVFKSLPGTSDELEIISVDRQTIFSSAATQIGFYPLGDTRYDTGLVVARTRLPLVQENELLPLFPADSMLARGAEVGWLGFPGITEPELCFFQGHVSGYLSDPPLYLIDGVAINGVSGGPVFDKTGAIIGLVSAYLPNRINPNTTLPGLMSVVPINAVRYWMEYRLGARVLKRSDQK